METENFGLLVRAAGMNPATDFVYADLRGCDFSDSDLRGFNFSGADLRGSSGRGVTWDKTTIFDGADIWETIFAFDAEQQRFFGDNPQWARWARSLASSEWLGVEQWLGKHLKDDANVEAVARVAFDVYTKTREPYVKSLILHYALYSYDVQDEYLDFLLTELAKPNPPAVLSSCLNVIGRMFAAEERAKVSCQLLLVHESEYVRRAALSALMNDIRGLEIPNFIKEYIGSEASGEIRRYYLGRIVRRMTPLHEMVARQSRAPGRYRDFNQPITKEIVAEVATFYVRGGDIERIRLSEDELVLPLHVTRNREAIAKYRYDQKRQKLVRLLFADFQRAGINFAFESQPSAAAFANLSTLASKVLT